MLRLARTWLESLGYQTLGARNGPEALDPLRPEPGRPIDAMITDLMMPGGINGMQLAETARALRPGIKVLLTSGSISGQSAAAAATVLGASVLRKPYRRGDLACALRPTFDDRDDAAASCRALPAGSLDLAVSISS